MSAAPSIVFSVHLLCLTAQHRRYRVYFQGRIGPVKFHGDFSWIIEKLGDSEALLAQIADKGLSVGRIGKIHQMVYLPRRRDIVTLLLEQIANTAIHDTIHFIGRRIKKLPIEQPSGIFFDFDPVRIAGKSAITALAASVKPVSL